MCGPPLCFPRRSLPPPPCSSVSWHRPQLQPLGHLFLSTCPGPARGGTKRGSQLVSLPGRGVKMGRDVSQEGPGRREHKVAGVRWSGAGRGAIPRFQGVGRDSGCAERWSTTMTGGWETRGREGGRRRDGWRPGTGRVTRFERGPGGTGREAEARPHSAGADHGAVRQLAARGAQGAGAGRAGRRTARRTSPAP